MSIGIDFRRMTSLIIIFAATSAFTSEPDGRQIVLRSQEATKLEGSEATATLTIFDNKGNSRIRKFTSASKKYSGGTTKMVMRFLEPADVKGTGILTFDNETGDDDMWIFMPALRKTRRIVSSEKTKSFMGSEFSNADLTIPDIDDYTYKILGSETVRDAECWKIEAVAAKSEVIKSYGYSRKIFWIAKSDFTTRKTEFYDANGQLVKTLDILEVKLVDEKNKKYQAVDLVMTNVKNNRKSQFKIEKIVFNPSISDEYFTVRYLEK